MEEALRSAKSFFNNTPDLAGAIRKLVEENADARKQLEAAAAEKAAQIAERLYAGAEVVNGIRVAKFEMSPKLWRVDSRGLLQARFPQRFATSIGLPMPHKCSVHWEFAMPGRAIALPRLESTQFVVGNNSFVSIVEPFSRLTRHWL